MGFMKNMKNKRMTTAVAAILTTTIFTTFMHENSQNVLAKSSVSDQSQPYKQATKAQKAIVYKLNKTQTLRKNSGLHHTNKAIKTIKKNQFVKLTGTQVVNGVSYARVNYNGKIGYVAQKALTATKATKAVTAKVKTGQIASTTTLRNTYGTNWTAKSVQTVKKGTKVTIISTLKFDGVSYTKIKVGSKTGYVKSVTVKATPKTVMKPLTMDLNVVKNIDAPTTTITGEAVTPTTNAQRMKIYNVSGNQFYKAYEDPTNPSDETVIRLYEGGVFGYVGNATINGVEYKQVVCNGIYYYVKADAIFNELTNMNTFFEDSGKVKDDYYYASKNIPVLNYVGYYPNGVKEQLSKNQMFKIIGDVYYKGPNYSDDDKMELMYKIAYMKNGKVIHGYILKEKIRMYEEEYADREDEEVINNYKDIIKTDLNKITSSTNTSSNTSIETNTTSSVFDTKLNDNRLRVINAHYSKVKLYSSAPTTKNKIVGKTLKNASMRFGSVLMIGKSVKTDKGTFVKIAYNNKQTAFIETKYLSNLKGRYVTSSPLDTRYGTVAAITNTTGKYLYKYIHGSKQSYDKYEHSFQMAFNIPVGITSDKYLVPATSEGQYYGQYTKGPKLTSDYPFLPSLSWNDIKNLKGDPDGDKKYSTPTKIETILKTYGKTKLYDFDLFNTYDDVDIVKTHIALAKLITKYKLENNVYVYSYFDLDSQKDVAKVNAEIKAINPKIKIILTAETKKVSTTVGKNISKYITDPNIDGFGLATADMTAANFKAMKAKKLLVHGMSYNERSVLNGLKYQSYEADIDGFKYTSSNTVAQRILESFK